MTYKMSYMKMQGLIIKCGTNSALESENLAQQIRQTSQKMRIVACVAAE